MKTATTPNPTISPDAGTIEYLAGIEQAIAATQRHIDIVLDEAMQIQEGYSNETTAFSETHFPKDLERSAGLTIRIQRSQSATGSAYLYWSRWTGWRVQLGRRRRSSKHIPSRSRRGGYAKQVLQRYAQDWELPIALRAEADLQSIRERLFSLDSLLQALTQTHERERSAIAPPDGE